jgi:hypothetical protein
MSESTNLTNQTRAAITAYFEGFNARDISRMPIGANVHFKAPVNPEPVVGLEALQPFLEQVFSTFEKIVVHRVVVEGEYASVMLDYYLPGLPAIPMVDCFRVIDGEVVEILPYFDTALLTQGDR